VLRIDRGPDFFALLRCQGEDSFVFIYEDAKGEIRGVASIVLRDGYIHGEIRRVGYLADLRTQFAREPLRIWRKLFAELLKEPVREFAGCTHWVTAVIDENRAADRALIKTKKGEHRYDPLTPYWMVNVFAKVLPVKSPDGIRVRSADIPDERRIREFLESENRAQAFGFDFKNEFTRRFKTWGGLRIQDFWLAEDRTGKILACTAAWSPSHSKRNVVDRLPFSLRALRPFLPVPARGEAVRSVYMTHLILSSSLSTSEKKQAFLALFSDFYRANRRSDLHMVSFCDFAALKLHSVLGSYLKQAIPMSLYVVRPRSSAPEQWSPDELITPGFEIALV
jgi:hypothetical protein